MNQSPKLDSHQNYIITESTGSEKKDTPVKVIFDRSKKQIDTIKVNCNTQQVMHEQHFYKDNSKVVELLKRGLYQ